MTPLTSPVETFSFVRRRRTMHFSHLTRRGRRRGAPSALRTGSISCVLVSARSSSSYYP